MVTSTCNPQRMQCRTEHVARNACKASAVSRVECAKIPVLVAGNVELVKQADCRQAQKVESIRNLTA